MKSELILIKTKEDYVSFFKDGEGKDYNAPEYVPKEFPVLISIKKRELLITKLDRKSVTKVPLTTKLNIQNPEEVEWFCEMLAKFGRIRTENIDTRAYNKAILDTIDSIEYTARCLNLNPSDYIPIDFGEIKTKETFIDSFEDALKQMREEAQKSDDAVNHPNHYGGKDNPHEAIKVIEYYNFNFSLGSALKYILRAGKKDDYIQDLKKAVWYLNREIERNQAGTTKK